MLHAWSSPVLFLCHAVTLPVNLYHNTVMCCVDLPAPGIKSQTNLYHTYVTQCQVIPHSNTEPTTVYNYFIKEQKKTKIMRVSTCPTVGEVKVPGLKYNSNSLCLSIRKNSLQNNSIKMKGVGTGRRKERDRNSRQKENYHDMRQQKTGIFLKL